MNRKPYKGVRNPLDPSRNINDFLNFNDSQTEIRYSECGGTLMARPTLVHNVVARKSKMDYPWTIEHNLDSRSEYDSKTSPLSIRQVSSLPHVYVADRWHELLTKFLDFAGFSRQSYALLIE
ncbi:MAG: hypothetical protein EZS28_033865 [Streblomastix strix]|uniref:Uncharacterized protein n=1 Tax=Streblomastix strix TaxID=222440 RepID=A0A5J4UJ79_9EUKA|nr:MAG: hypothetical protein EZS28_033865 [Streblomastix strix]